MEDSSQGGISGGGAVTMRRNNSYTQYNDRPASSASNHTRKTPSSSGASAISSSHSQTANNTPRAGSTRGASLLQERLRERKVESARVSSSSGERGGIQSSPIKGSMREERRPSSGMGGVGKGMGVKQIEEQVSTLHKQNFDLKLELYHRRQRQEALEARLEAAEKQLEEQSEMQEVNEQLLAELERRDQALDEAVGVIVVLEDKVDRMEREREMVRSVDEAPYIPTDEFSSSPPRMNEKTPRRTVVRMPSFLSDHSEGTEALRSLYLPPSHSLSDMTLPKLEEESFDGMNSPRLSVLSESSFLSVYGEKQFDLNAEPEEPKRHRASSSVEKWIDERPAPTATPQRASPELVRRKQFLSINDVLESPLQRLEKLKHTLEKHALPERSNSVNLKEKRRARGDMKKVFTDKKSFETQQSLPPTPDTFSTNTLRHYKGSNDTLAPDGTFLSSTSTFTPGITYNNYQSTLSMRPRSAGETVTSRREGHGWDTETQEDVTETESVLSTSSTYSPSAAYQPQQLTKRILTPDLFNFGSSGPDNRDRDWGRDVMFNHNEIEVEPQLPVHKRYNNIRRSSMVESQHPRSDDTVIQYNNKYADLQLHGVAMPTDRPSPPDRRSSLTAVSKLRKSNTAQQGTSHSSPTSPAKDAVQIQSTVPTPTSKKSRLASMLFGAGRNAPPVLTPESPQPEKKQVEQPPRPPPHASTMPTVQRQQQQRPTHNSSNRSQSNQYFDGLNSNGLVVTNEEDRATPPPIRRSKTTHMNGQLNVRGRPSSAGTGAGAVKRISGFGGDGVFDDGASETKKNGHRRESISVDLGVARGLSAILGVTPAAEGEGPGGENGGAVGGEGKKKWFGGLRRG